jgi:hypothetical protein
MKVAFLIIVALNIGVLAYVGYALRNADAHGSQIAGALAMTGLVICGLIDLIFMVTWMVSRMVR